MPSARAHRVIAVSRVAALGMLALESADSVAERWFGLDPLIAVLDEIALSAGVLALAALVIAEVVLRHLRHRIALDAHELEARRRHDSDRQSDHEGRRRRIEQVLETDGLPAIVFQPILELSSSTVVGYEALSRFPTGRPDEWFAEAHAVGLAEELELHAVRLALQAAPGLPEPRAYVSVNVSPPTLLRPELRMLLAPHAAERPLVVELTETVPIDDYERYEPALAELRAMNVRVAVDDAGAGYASLQHIIRLLPDIIKLDRSLITDIDNRAQQASLVRALASFSNAIGATLLAEGIETDEQLGSVMSLGVHCGQGYLLGRPSTVAQLPLADAGRSASRVA